MADKAPPDTIATLGTILDETAKRDAIHIAVEPAIAAHTLRPGEDVGFEPDGTVAAAYGSRGKAVGIVDPFLTKPVTKGQRFWLYVYPRQITSLRHVWTHPDFKDEAEIQAQVSPDYAQVKAEHAESKAWLQDFAESVCVDYARLIERAKEYELNGWLWNEGSRFDGEYVPDEFWDHYERVTGEVVERRGNFFACSC